MVRMRSSAANLITLTNQTKENMICTNSRGVSIQVSEADAAKFMIQDRQGNWKFSLNSRGYPCVSYALPGESRKCYLLHRLLMDAPPEKQIDHVNRDRLDNRRENLRLCTRSQNNQNRAPRGESRFIGVSFDKRTGKWMAQCRFSGQRKTIGRFASEIDAAKAHDAFVLNNSHTFSPLNFPEGYQAVA